MKKFTKYFICLLFAGTMSCNDAIDITQPGLLSADAAFQSVADLNSGLLGSYRFLDVSTDIQFNAVFTDEVSIGFDSGGQWLGNGEYGFVLNPQSAASVALWNNSYDALNSVTRLIEAAANIEPTAAEQATYNNILGQAHALRAYTHFKLLSYLSPDLTNAGAPGVIILETTPGIEDRLPRNTTGETLASIDSDLTMAAGLLDPAGNGNTFIGPDFVTALRARIAAYTQDYTTAATLAGQLLANYDLADRAQYEAMWDDNDDTEVIFQLERTINDNYDGQGATGSGFAGGWAGANFAFVNSTIDGSPYGEMSRTLFNIMDPADIRTTVVVDATSIISPDYQNADNFQFDDILVISKYPGSEGQPLMNNLKVFRASEMQLILAEARAANGDLAGAATAIQELRDARMGAATPALNFASAAEAFGVILDERRVELCYEGHRWLDLKRLGARANRAIDRDPLDCAINGACNLAISDHRMAALPIPLVELDANPNIEQNAGY